MDVGSSRSEVYRCIQFAKKVPEFWHACQNLAWREITRNLLPTKQRTDKARLSDISDIFRRAGKFELWPTGHFSWDYIRQKLLAGKKIVFNVSPTQIVRHVAQFRELAGKMPLAHLRRRIRTGNHTVLKSAQLSAQSTTGLPTGLTAIL